MDYWGAGLAKIHPLIFTSALCCMASGNLDEPLSPATYFHRDLPLIRARQLTITNISINIPTQQQALLLSEKEIQF